MAAYECVPQHNMVALLTHDDTHPMFHQIMDFLSRSSINYALTVAPRVATSWVEAFWRTAKTRDIDNVASITTTVASK